MLVSHVGVVLIQYGLVSSDVEDVSFSGAGRYASHFEPSVKRQDPP